MNPRNYQDFRNVTHTPQELAGALKMAQFELERIQLSLKDLLSEREDFQKFLFIVRSCHLNNKIMDHFIHVIADGLIENKLVSSEEYLEPGEDLYSTDFFKEKFKKYQFHVKEEEYLLEQENFDMVFESMLVRSESTPLGASLEPENVSLLCLLFQQFVKWTENLILVIGEFVKYHCEGDFKDYLVELSYIQYTVRSFSKLIFIGMRPMKNPFLKLLYKTADSPEWQKMEKYVTKIKSGDAISIHQTYMQMFQNLLRITYKDCPGQLHQFIMTATVEDVRKALNMSESEKYAALIDKALPQVSTEKIIYIPKDSESIKSSMKGGRINKVSLEYENYFDDPHYYSPDDHVKVRCMNNDLYQDVVYPVDNHISTVIIHIHGGGFMCMSSKTHTLHTKTIMAETGVPIFSIDYRLAPENPFPAAIED